MHFDKTVSVRRKRLFFSALLFALFGIVSTTNAQTSDARFDWVKAVGGSGWDGANSVTTDTSGNVYIGGYFEDTVDFDPGASVDNRTSAGVGDAFVSKYDASGNYEWTKTVGGTGNDSGYSVSTDSGGNVYIGGWFSNTVDFDPGASVDNRTSVGGTDAFVSKYDASGNHLWTNAYGGVQDDDAYSIALDADGNVYVWGEFRIAVDFDPGVGTDLKTSSGGWDVYLSKYDTSGNYQWTRAFGGTSNEYAYSVTVDHNGNVYIVGDFQGTVDFDPESGTDLRTSNGSHDGFIRKYDSSGDYHWTKMFGGLGFDWPHAVATDSSGNVYIGGGFENTVDFDSGVGVDNRTSAGSTDAFVSKYDQPGNYQWTNVFGGTGDEWPYSIEADSSGNVYIGGYFEDTVDFDPGASVDNRTSAGGSDAFVSKFDATDNYQWTKTFGGTVDDWVNTVNIDLNSSLYIGGTFANTVDFDSGSGVDNRTSTGSGDAFFAKFSTVYLDSGPTNLTLDINATIAISCDASVAMSAIVGTGKSDITLAGNKATDNMAMCNIKTNASGGYKMEWKSSSTIDASGSMKNATNDIISPYSLSGSSETWSIAATASEWGAKLGASSEGYGTGDGGGDYSYASAGGWGTNDGYDNGKWMNVPTTPFQIMQKSTETDVDGEYQYLVFGAEIGADKLQPTGTYTQEVTVTATTL